MMLRPSHVNVHSGRTFTVGGGGQEGGQEGGQGTSCENTVKEALVLISRILEVYLLKGKKEINGLCAGLFLIVLP